MEKFKPTIEWMTTNYKKYNELLFDGELGSCNFEVFTTGEGSNGNVLGWFSMKGKNIRYQTNNRRMYKDGYMKNGIGFEKQYIYDFNFVELCVPTISLNGNYSWTENAMINTLVHEMCHYYTYMRGVVPKQAHGTEFKRIARLVSISSNGLITIERLARAEQMSEMELDQHIKEKNDKRNENKLSKMKILLNITKSGQYRITTTSSQELIDKYISYLGTNTSNIYLTDNIEVTRPLFELGYKKNVRTLTYWILEGKAKKIVDDTLSQNLWTKLFPKEEKVNQQTFRINTSKGEIRIRFSSFDELIIKIKQQLPKLNDEMIQKLINNKNNFITESIINNVIDKLLKEVIDEKMNNIEDEVIEINPNINLGLDDSYIYC